VLTELSQTDDAAVIRRSIAEPHLFTLVYERHAAALHRYAARRIGPDAADDVVAETFLAAFRRRNRYDLSRPAAGPWLYGIASNLIARHRRAEVRMYRAYARTGVDPLPGSVPQADVEAEVDARVDAAGHRPALAGALARLAARDRDVLLLIAWGELSYNEVAQALGIPVGTVRSRLNRARRQVQAALATTKGDHDG